MYVLFLQIIAERKQYHERTGGRYLKHFDDMTETDDEKIVGSMYAQNMQYFNLLLY